MSELVEGCERGMLGRQHLCRAGEGAQLKSSTGAKLGLVVRA